MRRVSIDNITGKEMLARDLYAANGVVILPKDSVVKPEYVNRLRELGIQYIYVLDDIDKDIVLDKVTEEIIKEQCQETVKNTIEKYSHCGNAELSSILKVAENIMTGILEQPEVMYNISCVRDKSDSTYSHSINVAALTVLIALRMHLSEDKVKEIAVGALLHDIGIVFVPFDVSNLIFEDCNELQQKELKKHVITGYSMVVKESWLTNVSKDIILLHHEREDGYGFPMHLTGDRIGIGTKIVAVCDEFDSRVYGNIVKKQKVRDVFDYIISEAGVKFDFQVVQVFIESVAAYPIGTYVKTNNGEIGIVVRQNSKMPTRPIIRMVQNNDGTAYTTFLERDLTKELTLYIVDTIDE